jgi:hypothetical protein
MAKKRNLRIEECMLGSVNLATEGSQENPTSRTDLSYEGLANKKALAMLIGCDNVDAIWDDEGNIQWLGITEIKSRVEIDKCVITFLGQQIGNVRVKKFSFKPISGRQIEIKLQAQVHHTKEELVLIDSWQKKVGVLLIETTQADLFADPEDHDEGEGAGEGKNGTAEESGDN